MNDQFYDILWRQMSNKKNKKFEKNGVFFNFYFIFRAKPLLDPSLFVYIL